MNKFINTNRIISINKHIIQKENNNYLSFIIEYDRNESKIKEEFKCKPKVDYKDLLSPDDFIIFSKLRDIRKEIAEKEGVPAYKVFTNDQLAEIVKNKYKTKSDIGKISGIGESRINNYAEKFIEFMGSLNKNKE